MLGLLRGLGRGKFSHKQSRKFPLTSKRGNLDFYKGKGARRQGAHTNKGGYVIQDRRVMDIVAPELSDFKLTPYVSHATPLVQRKPATEEPVVVEAMKLLRAKTAERA